MASALGTLPGASCPKETVEKAQQPLSVTPFAGTVPAFGSVPLEFTFAPPVFREGQGFLCNRTPERHSARHEFAGKIESEELNLALPLKLLGTAVLPALKVSPDMLQFGQCPVNHRRDIVLRITNAAQSMPLDFEIPRVPHMSIQPMKGKLAPLQNTNVVVSFTPKALGKFAQDLIIKYCSNLYSHTMRCFGEAPVLGEKVVPVKGLERTGRDFDPEHVYVNQDQLNLPPRTRNLQTLTKIMKEDLERNQNSSDALDSIMLDLPEPTPYSLSPSAMQEHVRNKQRYNKMLKESRLRRKARLQEQKNPTEPIDIFYEDDVNMGMMPGSGLKSPRYNVDDIPVDRLHLERALDDDSAARGVTGHRYMHDENKLIKKKYKAGPTTQAEVRECSASLENWQLGLISVGPGVLDFGNVYVKSTVVKSFSVFNDLPQAILVAMQYDAEELSRSTPTSQVVPSAHAAGFDVSVCSAVPQTFQRQVVYTINGIHPYKLLIKATITPVQIRMSRADINFRFGEDSLDKTLTEKLVLDNPGNAPAKFSWQGANASFSVSPVSGVIPRGGSQGIEVTFTPPNSGQLMEGFLTLKVEDGNDHSLRCVGQAPEATLNFGVKRLDLGVLAVGLPADRSIPIVNGGKTVAVYHVDSVPDGVGISPMRGRVSAEGRAELIDVHVLLDRPMQLESAVTLNVRGGKPIRLPIMATAVNPNIEFIEDEIEFGQLTLGALGMVPISLKNSSAVEGTLYVNLQPYPEFSLSLCEERPEAYDADYDATALQPISLQQYQLAIGGVTDNQAAPSNAMTAKPTLMGSPQGATQMGPPQEDEDEEANSQVYKITVQPNYTLHMQLTYKPTDLGQHFFEFPVMAAGGGKSEGLRKVVHAEALRPRMLFSATDLNFKTKVVASGIQSVASVLELALHNADDFPIEWRIDTEPLKKFMGVFTVDPAGGILHPAQDCLVRAAFMPNEPVEYKANMNVYISPPRDAGKAGDASMALPADESKPYLSLRMKGQGTVPKLTFDRREIVLPTVPLGIKSRCLFYIVNEGYESLDVKYRLPNDQIRIPLTINFPEGQQIGITKPKIPVEIFFQSNKPISFCAKIEFLDNESGSYVLPVSGTTENCILTCHHYLHNNTDFYTLEGEPVMLQEKEDNSNGEQGAAPSIKTGSVSHQSVAGYGNQDMSQADFLVRWLNGNILKNQLDHFPQDLVNSNGRHLYELIEFLSGKMVPNKAAAPAAPQRMDNTGSSFRGNDRGAKQKSREMQKILQLMQQFEVLLNFLKQHGALLASVRPEHFLSHENYLRYQQSLNVGITRRQVDKMFFPKSMEAWMTCILQTVKIFLLNRITSKAFKTLPGMTAEMDHPVGAAVGAEDLTSEQPEKKSSCPELQSALDTKFLADSNVYSMAECILLRWLNFHFWRANKGRYPFRKVCCFDADLEDSVVLAVVIQSHVPHCQAVQNMRAQCTSLDHHEENAMHIIAALSEIGLAFPIQVSDIASPQAKDMLLFAMFLFQNLPNYVPKTTIVFSTMLGVNMTKNIELTNPSKKAITYLVQLVGSSGSDFAIKEDTIKLEPRQTFSYPVEYCSRFSRLVEDKIMFTSKREGNVHAAAMVFKLRSRCTGRKPRKTINVSAVLYEVGTVDVDLENPFSEDAEFTVALRESTICDAEKNPVSSKRCEGMEAFYLSSTRCRVKAGSTGKLTISFLPFEAPAHFTALLGVFDSKAGEYYYELMGTSSPPLPLETYKMQVKAEASGTKDIILPLRNMQVERARTWLQNRGAGPPNPPDYITYDVKVSSPYYTAPKQVSIYNGNAGKGEGKGRGPAADRSQGGDGRRPSAQASQVAKLVVEFWPKEPGVYPCTVTLTSDVDIRIYQFEGTGTAPNTHCSLTFTTQARKPITQEIPIVNPTDREWAIKPTFSQIGHEFDGPREFFAKKKGATGQATVTTYPLTFKPEWVCDVKAQLVLYNVGTNETYEYDLHGIAEEPLAEEHVVVKCEAREKTSHVFSVKNHSNMTATFEVESDLVHISGPSSIQVDGRGTGEYELVFQPLQAGQVTGCIMFRDTHTGHFTWYTVELMTLPPKPQQQLTLTCVVRQAVAVDIQLVNPLDDVVVFEVALNGDGLLGEAEFVLAPKETATYELVFSPLLPARTKGTAVFFNEVVGEFWYDLSLIAEAALPEEIPLLQCELGRTAQTTVKVDNPTGQEVALKHRSTNKINFKVMNNRIILPPLESTEITIEYSPSSLGVTEEAQIVFEHPSIGSWVYKAQGLGLPPLEARSVTVAAQVNRTVSSTIQFKNPFLETITIFIVLESKSEKGVFNLLSKKAKVQIGPLATTQIPFSFCPPTMTQHTAEIALSAPAQRWALQSHVGHVPITEVMKPNLTWSYRVQGVAEAPADPTLHTFTVQARESLQTTYALTLIGLDTTPGDRHGDQLSCQLEVPPQHQAMVSKCFDINLDSEAPVRTASSQASKARSSRAADGQVMLKVNFSPLRPFIALCNLVITRASGGRWRFDLKLEATEPEVDDVISIQSPLNKPASVAFRLNNHTSVYSEFEAFFDAESAYEFTVQPTSGVLEPAGTSGTTFVVTYKPTEYGKPVQGKLIIQTEDVFWSYMVKGTHPKYSAPVVDKPKVATRLTREMEAQLQKASTSRRKNFIKEPLGCLGL
ncbi:CFAP47 [Symbiodinium natans]|uniref:CFAP47 protein n=3 Tax=Symbiodinium TaxID=2949 RepID=A0A812PH32_9DINO|nr:CFAP47 [Symbiodinium natans]